VASYPRATIAPERNCAACSSPPDANVAADDMSKSAASGTAPCGDGWRCERGSMAARCKEIDWRNGSAWTARASLHSCDEPSAADRTEMDVAASKMAASKPATSRDPARARLTIAHPPTRRDRCRDRSFRSSARVRVATCRLRLVYSKPTSTPSRGFRSVPAPGRVVPRQERPPAAHHPAGARQRSGCRE
jgi:hypothetical protein